MSTTKTFWDQKVGWMNAGDVTEDGEPCVRFNGAHFVLGSRGLEAPASCRGFAGQRCTITLKDGRVLTSVDVWHQGMIPDEYRHELPDNAISMEWR